MMPLSYANTLEHNVIRRIGGAEVKKHLENLGLWWAECTGHHVAEET